MTNLEKLSQKEKNFIAWACFLFTAPKEKVQYELSDISEMLFAYALKNMLLIKYEHIQSYLMAIDEVLNHGETDFEEKYIEIFKPLPTGHNNHNPY